MKWWLLVLGLVIGCKDGSGKSSAPVLKPLLEPPAVRMVYEVHGDGHAIGQRELDAAGGIIGRRLAAMGVERGNVRAGGEQLIVELGSIDDGRLDQLRVRLVGELAFRMVRHGTELMRRAASEARRRVKVDGEVESWIHSETGRRFRDYFVVADDADDIRAHFERLAREGVAVIDKDSMIGIERVVPRLRERDKRFRSYLVWKKIELGGAHIRSAKVIRDKQTGEPRVMVELTAAGKAAFAKLTREKLGEKVAIFLGDRIKSAPVIQSPIPGGKVQVSMGGRDPKQMLREAQDLVVVLRSGSVPAPLHLVRVDRLR
jgi:preprotein translocase subunit SecD